MPLIDCPECDGRGGWMNIDGLWVECTDCEGSGYLEDDDIEDDE